MIQFDSTSAIYLQVADFMSEKILIDEWSELERMPSIREVASMVQVNPNTVMRSYAHLQDNEVIHNKRGVGYFVSENGKAQIQKIKKIEFIQAKLPRFFREADLLSITPVELTELYEQHLREKV